MRVDSEHNSVGRLDLVTARPKYITVKEAMLDQNRLFVPAYLSLPAIACIIGIPGIYRNEKPASAGVFSGNKNRKKDYYKSAKSQKLLPRQILIAMKAKLVYFDGGSFYHRY